jgi:hypothetical protein
MAAVSSVAPCSRRNTNSSLLPALLAACWSIWVTAAAKAAGLGGVAELLGLLFVAGAAGEQGEREGAGNLTQPEAPEVRGGGVHDNTRENGVSLILRGRNRVVARWVTRSRPRRPRGGRRPRARCRCPRRISACEFCGVTRVILTLPTRTSSRLFSPVSGSTSSSPSMKTSQTWPTLMPDWSLRLMVTILSRLPMTRAGEMVSAARTAIFCAISARPGS